MASRIRDGCHAARAALLLVALLAVIQGSAAAGRSLLAGSCKAQDGSFFRCADSSMCCSKYGYCGVGTDYCGDGCRNGPCTGTTPAPTTPLPPAGPAGSGWTSFFTKAVFEAWFPYRKTSFYTYEAFKRAAVAYPAFGTSKSADDHKREIAAFFGNIQQESGGLQYIEEIDGRSRNYCDPNNAQYPCAPGKAYFGRGPIQLTWNYNYGACGQALGMGLSLLQNPDQVAQNGDLAFKTALWFWMSQGPHGAIIKSPPSFAGTIRAINGDIECGHGSNAAVNNRVNYYKKFCKSLGVNPGTDLYC